jgi:AraC-like DNA-binding protein
MRASFYNSWVRWGLHELINNVIHKFSAVGLTLDGSAQSHWPCVWPRTESVILAVITLKNSSKKKSAPAMTDIDTFEDQLPPGQLSLALFDTLKKTSFFIKDRERRFVTGNPALAKGLNKRHIRELIGITRRIDESDADFRQHPEMERIIDYVQKNYSHNISKAEMAKAANISQSTLERLFRKTFGITPGQYARRVRLNAACWLVSETGQPLAEIARKCGFKDQTYMPHAFRSDLKLTPHKYRMRYRDLSA